MSDLDYDAIERDISEANEPGLVRTLGGVARRQEAQHRCAVRHAPALLKRCRELEKRLAFTDQECITAVEELKEEEAEAATLRTQNAALVALVEEAYGEGWEHCALRSGTIIGFQDDWKDSDTRTALRRITGEGE